MIDNQFSGRTKALVKKTGEAAGEVYPLRNRLKTRATPVGSPDAAEDS